MQLGNLHPLIVHLPIGILLLAFLMELHYLKKASIKDNGIVLFTLGIGALSALFSVATGWLLGDHGGYDEVLLTRHKWIAVAFLVGCILLFFLKKSNNKKTKKIYLPFFTVVLILLVLTGHYGGSLTHGEDFLFQKAYEDPIIENVEEAKVYAEIVQPILQQKCVSCHNSGKAKGGLLLTSPKELLAGGDSGSLLDSLEQEQPSLLLHRIHLPLEEKEHMPPKGKVQLTPEEIILLEWWMKNENCFDCVTKDLPASDRVSTVLASLEKDTSIRAQIAEKLEPVPSEYLKALNQNRLSAQTLAEDSPLLLVNFTQRKDLTENDFELLYKYKKNIVEMNLAYTNIDDELAKTLKEFKNLTKLHLQQTQITNIGLEKLKNLNNLETLNLFGTQVNDDALTVLSNLSNLKQLYVWQTQMTREGLLTFKKSTKTITIQGQIADSVFAVSSLGPPTILADREIFQDSLLISLEQYIDGAKIHYAINDTLPQEYSGPFYLKKTSKLSAFVTMEGWEPSTSITKSFLQSKIGIKRIALQKSPHPKYVGKKGLTLMDQKRGTSNFVDGNWVGYEGQHMVATIEFDKKSTITNVSVGSLSIPNNWIFAPVGYTVWGSEDGINYSKLKSIKLPKPQPPENAIERSVYTIDFNPVQVKKAKILVESTLKNPDWHAVPGGNSFIFLDEVIFN
ncbi:MULTISPECIES: DUF2231 domain-containing protein [Flavobacteriaceae]|uniref:DUF2231 domain-containing protein n=1 Tax=Flavobacteriaceae TaxID=49546 RepID=UPI001491C559|nr:MULTISPECIES: DUF2231 domain-containing protein [Allomuricauda]MDC6365930.1 FN3 associated domain-containing protein [Muricauda sp. AC10]